MSALPPMTQTKRLPLHEQHARKGAKFGLFGDWEVPLYYSSILEEHDAVRKRAGLFDISHMGEFFIEGPGSLGFLETLLCRSIEKMEQGKALYMPLLNSEGGMIDDIIVYRLGTDSFLIIVNAGNVEKDFDWFLKCKAKAARPDSFSLENRSDELGLLALQGPKSAEILERATGTSFQNLKYYHFIQWKSGMISRTGYTGEDGFEIMVEHKDLQSLWDSLFSEANDLIPVGFGARDTLRLEAAMPLYGHDMDDQISPLELGIDWAVDMQKKSFVGRDALLNLKSKGIHKHLIGFEMIERGIPRQGFSIAKLGRKIGVVTSGSFSPTLQKNIGLGFVPVAEARDANDVDIIIREKPVKARVVKLPFYKRKK